MKVQPASKIVALKVSSKKDLPNLKGIIEVVEKDRPEIGEVVAIGKGRKPVPFEIGSILAYRKFGEFKFWLQGEEVIFVSFADILAVLTGDN